MARRGSLVEKKTKKGAGKENQRASSQPAAGIWFHWGVGSFKVNIKREMEKVRWCPIKGDTK